MQPKTGAKISMNAMLTCVSRVHAETHSEDLIVSARLTFYARKILPTLYAKVWLYGCNKSSLEKPYTNRDHRNFLPLNTGKRPPINELSAGAEI